MNCAPVALFVYNRPGHTARTLEALALNTLASDTEIIAFSDGPKTVEDAARVSDVRSIVNSACGFKRISLVARNGNAGLSESIIQGVGEVAERHPRFIVLEDDLLTVPAFLQYMNDGLRKFESDNQVGSIHGFCFPIRSLPEYFFMKGADCWGWASWSDRWKLFEPDGRVLMHKLIRERKLSEFNRTNGAGLAKMLVDQISGKNDSWAVRWHASLFLHGLLTLHPGRTFVRNIGLDSSGTHSQEMVLNETSLRTDYQGLTVSSVAADMKATDDVHRFLLGQGYGAAMRYHLSYWHALLRFSLARPPRPPASPCGPGGRS